MSKKKAILSMILTLVIGLGLGFGISAGLNSMNQTGTAVDDAQTDYYFLSGVRDHLLYNLMYECQNRGGTCAVNDEYLESINQACEEMSIDNSDWVETVSVTADEERNSVISSVQFLNEMVSGSGFQTSQVSQTLLDQINTTYSDIGTHLSSMVSTQKNITTTAKLQQLYDNMTEKLDELQSIING